MKNHFLKLRLVLSVMVPYCMFEPSYLFDGFIEFRQHW
jgi:hypothetical protein